MLDGSLVRRFVDARGVHRMAGDGAGGSRLAATVESPATRGMVLCETIAEETRPTQVGASTIAEQNTAHGASNTIVQSSGTNRVKAWCAQSGTIADSDRAPLTPITTHTGAYSRGVFCLRHMPPYP